MKKIIVSVVLIMSVLSVNAFAQRYHYDPAAGKNQQTPKGTREYQTPPSSYKGTTPQGTYKGTTPRGYKGGSYPAVPQETTYNYNGTQKIVPITTYRHFFEINAASSEVEARLGMSWPVWDNFLSFGLDGLFSDEDYFIINGNLTYGNTMFSPRLRFDIGFKGLGGVADIGDQSSTLGCFGFLFKGAYDIPEVEVFTDFYLDLELLAELTVAPGPLAFSDTDNYYDTRIALAINVTQDKRSSLILGYRKVKMEFEDPVDWEKKNDKFYFGFRLRF